MNLENMLDLVALEKYARGFECALNDGAARFVWRGGNPNSKIVVIGEAPGAEEDKVGKPFVGRSGQLLLQLFGEVGLAREDLYITNMMFWRPPENRTPTKKELALTLPIVRRHLALIQPEVVVLVGNVPAQTILETKEGVTKLHGRWQSLDIGGRAVPAMAVYHPAYVLRNRGEMGTLRGDLGLVAAKLANGG